MYKNIAHLIPCFGAILFLFTVFGCSPAVPDKTYTPKENLTIDLLTTFNGQEIYRITDGEHSFYMTDQRGVISYDQREGKTTVPRMIVSGGAVTSRQEGNEIIMEVRFKVEPIVEKE